jgi:hypothetical protein
MYVEFALRKIEVSFSPQGTSGAGISERRPLVNECGLCYVKGGPGRWRKILRVENETGDSGLGFVPNLPLRVRIWCRLGTRVL